MATRTKAKSIQEAAPLSGGSIPLEKVQEMQGQYDNTLELFQERITQLELALEDFGWYRQIGESNQEFSRQGLRLICQIARINFLKNPIIQRGVKVTADYVFGQGVSFKADNPDVQECIQRFWEDDSNRKQLTSQPNLITTEHELEVQGNLFFVFFTNADTGRVQVRTIPVEEIQEIYTDPDDRQQVQFYKRTWVAEGINLATGQEAAKQYTAYYPDWRFQPKSRPAQMGGVEVRWDTPVYHVKVGGLPDMKFGVPEFYAAIDWAKAYKDFLEDWATIVRAYSRFAWQLTTKGGAKGVAAAKAKLQTTLNLNQIETNPPPVTGSFFLPQEGNKLEPIRTAGATTSADDGRRLLLMAAAVMGLPESFFGDVSVGTLATAKSLDRPTELKMRNRQTFWEDVFIDLFRVAVLASAHSTSGLLAGGKVVIEVDADGNQRILNPDGTLVSIEAKFPPILEHDVDAQVTAVVNAATLAGHPIQPALDQNTITTLLCQALGVADVDAVIEAVEQAQADAQAAADKAAAQQLELAKTKAAAATPPPAPPQTPLNPAQPATAGKETAQQKESSALAEAALQIRKAVAALQERYRG